MRPIVGFDARMVYYRQAGIGQYILNLLRELALLQQECNDFDLLILQSRKEARQPTEWLFEAAVAASEKHHSLKKISTGKLWTPPHHRLEQLALPLETALANLAVLHSPDFIPPLIRKRWRRGLRSFASVITIHDLAFLKFPHLLTAESAAYYGQIKKAAESAERIIAVSKATARDIESQLGIDPAKIRVVYEAANPIFRPLSLEALDELARKTPALVAKLQEANLFHAGSASVPDFILFVSTIEPRKNLPILLRAFRQFLDNLTETEHKPKLILAGREGWLFADVYRLAAELNLQPNREIVWLGGVSTDELLWLYNKAAFLVMPSLYEGFGLPPLEALACGTGVVAANTSSLPEVVGDLGLLVAPEDVAAWTAALLMAWQEQGFDRPRFREAGPTWAKKFSWRQAAIETLEIYRELFEK